MEYELVAFMVAPTPQNQNAWSHWQDAMQVKNITAVMFQVNTADDKESVVRSVNEGFRVVALVEMRSQDKRGVLISMLDEGISFEEVMRRN